MKKYTESAFFLEDTLYGFTYLGNNFYFPSIGAGMLLSCTAKRAISLSI